ncbi:hypothetical protein LH400_19465 [Aurantimonas sp. VKM B-3413]|nr:hypothetical protein [Aurantimonas sp. VKM B-3413]
MIVDIDEADMDAAVASHHLAVDAGRNTPARVAAEFARARRHSRYVRLLKIGLPVVATLIFIGGGIAVWLARSLPDDVSVSAASIDKGRVVMQDPRMSGVDGNDRPYELVAQRAIQSLTGGRIDLERVKARVAIGDDAQADISAKAGSYDATTGTLALTDGIGVETTNGITIHLTDADIDLSSGKLLGTGPVMIKTASQTIRSQTVTVADGGKMLSFGGRVRMLLEPAATAGSDQERTVGE